MDNSREGQIVISEAGRDIGVISVIVAEDDTGVYLVDGKYHTMEHPKKKNLRHIRFSESFIPETIRMRLYNKEKVFDHEIKYAIKMFKGEEVRHVKE